MNARDEPQHDEHLHQLFHDINNCLSVVSMGTEILKGVREDDRKFAAISASMEKEQQEAIRLLRDLMSATCEGCA